MLDRRRRRARRRRARGPRALLDRLDALLERRDRRRDGLQGLPDVLRGLRGPGAGLLHRRQDLLQLGFERVRSGGRGGRVRPGAARLGLSLDRFGLGRVHRVAGVRGHRLDRRRRRRRLRQRVEAGFERAQRLPRIIRCLPLHALEAYQQRRERRLDVRRGFAAGRGVPPVHVVDALAERRERGGRALEQMRRLVAVLLPGPRVDSRFLQGRGDLGAGSVAVLGHEPLHGVGRRPRRNAGALVAQRRLVVVAPHPAARALRHRLHRFAQEVALVDDFFRGPLRGLRRGRPRRPRHSVFELGTQSAAVPQRRADRASRGAPDPRLRARVALDPPRHGLRSEVGALALRRPLVQREAQRGNRLANVALLRVVLRLLLRQFSSHGVRRRHGVVAPPPGDATRVLGARHRALRKVPQRGGQLPLVEHQGL